MATLKATYQYLNPHDAYYQKLKTFDSFNQYTDSLYKDYASSGKLVEGENILYYLEQQTQEGIFNIDQFASKMRFDLGDDDYRKNAIMTELFKDELQTVRDQTFRTWNADKAQWEEQTIAMSDYDYQMQLLNEQRDALIAKDIERQEQEYKKNRNGFMKFLSANGDFIVTPVLLIANGFMDALYTTGSFFEGIGRGVGTTFSEGSFAKGFKQAFIKDSRAIPSWEDVGFRNTIAKWLGEWSYIVDVDGTYTTFGKYVGGVFDTIGKMLPTVFLSAGLGAVAGAAGKATGATIETLATTQKAISIIANSMYYSMLSTGTFQDLVNNPDIAEAGIPAWKLMLNAGVKGAVEWGVQYGLNKIFTPSAMDKMVFGYKNVSSAVETITTGSVLKKLAIDAFHEGLEEYLQEYSNYVVDQFFAIDNAVFQKTSEWNVKTAFDAFFLGAMSSIAMSTFNIIKSTIGDSISAKNDIVRIQKAMDGKIKTIKYWENGKKVSQEVPVDYNNKYIKRIAKQVPTAGAVDPNATHIEYSIIDTRPKVNFLKRYGYKSTLQDLGQMFNDALNSAKTDYERNQVIGQAIVTLQNISALYGELGAERFANAQKMLEKIQQNYESKIKLSNEDYSRRATRNLSSGISRTSIMSGLGSYNALSASIGEQADTTPEYERRSRLQKDAIEAKVQVLSDTLNAFSQPKLSPKVAKRLSEEAKKLGMDIVVTDIAKATDEVVKSTNVLEDALERDAHNLTVQIANDLDAEVVVANIAAPLILGDYNYPRDTRLPDISKIIKGVAVALPADLVANAKNKRTVIKTILAEELSMVISEIMKRQKYNVALNEMATIYNSIYHTKVTPEQLLTNLLYNKEFQHKIVWNANKSAIEFIGAINAIIDGVKSQTELSQITKQVLSNSVYSIKTELKAYIIAQQEANYDALPLFDKADVKEIHLKRYGMDFRNAVVKGDIKIDYIDGKFVVSSKDYKDFANVLQTRVNNINNAQVKAGIIERITSTDARLRIEGFSQLDRYYKGVFNTLYDGKTYLPGNSLAENQFNDFLHFIGKTISTLTDANVDENIKSAVTSYFGKFNVSNLLSYYYLAFRQYSGNAFQFTYNTRDRSVKVVSDATGTVNRTLGNLSKEYNAYWQQTVTKNNFAIVRPPMDKNGVPLLKSMGILNTDVAADNTLAAGITLTDVILNPGLLSNDIRNAIGKDINALTTYSYLHNYILQKSAGEIGIVLMNNNTYQFVSINETINTLNKTVDYIANALVDAEDGQVFYLRDFIKIDYLLGKLRDTTIKIDKSFNANGAAFNVQNQIVLNNTTNANRNAQNLVFDLLHEFKHMLQYESNMNNGFNPEAFINIQRDTNGNIKTIKINDTYLNVSDKSVTTEIKRLLADFKRFTNADGQNNWIPDGVANEISEYLRKTKPKSTKIITELIELGYFIYYTSGEIEAYGSSLDVNSSYIVNMYPTVIGKDNTVTMPWGITYNLADRTSPRSIEQTNKVKAYVDQDLTTYDFDGELNNSFHYGIILDGGSIKLDFNRFTHYELFSELENKYGDAAIAFQKSVVEIANQSLYGNGFSYSIRFNGAITRDQYSAIVDFVNDRLAEGATIDIENTVDGRYASGSLAEGYENASQLLRSVGLSEGRTKLAPYSIAPQSQSESKATSIDDAEPGKDGRVYINKEMAKNNTNLQYFLGSKNFTRIDYDVAQFIAHVDASKLDPELWSYIGGSQKGTLNIHKIYAYVRDNNSLSINNPTSQYTLDMLNKYIFHNDYVDTVEKFNTLVSVEIKQYYALRALMRAKRVSSDVLNEVITPEKFVELVNKYTSDPRDKATFDRIVKRYTERGGGVKDVSIGALRLHILKNFDGTIQTAGAIAGREKIVAYYGKKQSGEVSTVSANAEIGDGEISILDNIADINQPSQQEQLEAEDVMVKAVNEIVEYRYYKLLQKVQEGIAKGKMASQEHIKQMLIDIQEDTESWTPKQLAKAYKQIDFNDEDYRQYRKLDENAEVVESVAVYKRRIASIIRTIKHNISKKGEVAKRTFLKYWGEYFDSDLNVKSDALNGNANQLKILHEKIKSAGTELSRGRFDSGERSVKTYKIKQDAKKELKETKAKLKQERAEKQELKTKLKNAQKFNSTTKVENIVIGEHEFKSESTVEMPSKLKTVMNTTFDSTYKTDVKYLSEADEKHTKIELKKFLQNNAETLFSLSQTDIEEILDYFDGQTFISSGNTKADIKFNAIKHMLLAYIYEQNRDKNIALNENYYNKLVRVLEADASYAGTLLAVHRATLQQLKPIEVIIAAMAKSNDLHPSEASIASLADAIRTNNAEALKASIIRMKEEMLAEYQGRKPSLLNSLWKFQRMMMLSNPGTWIRNWTSNIIVEASNIASDWIGKFFTSKLKQREGQYVITGVKVSSEVAQYISTEIIESGLFDLIKDGLSKYDTKRFAKLTGNDAIVDMIRESIQSQIFMENQFASDKLNTLSKALYKVLSDEPWIKRKAIKYLGKIMQEEIDSVDEDGNPKLKLDGTTASKNKVLELFAKAYSLASYDYMHRVNIISKLERVMERELPKGAFLLYKQIAPFASTGWNWFIEGLKYTPMGLVKAIVDYAKLEKRIAKITNLSKYRGPDVAFTQFLAKRNLGKGAIGTIGTIIGILLGAFGVARVDEEDKELKIFIGNVGVNISSLFGTSGILMGMAITSTLNGNGNWWNALIQSADVTLQDSLFADFYNMFRYAQSFASYVSSMPFTIMNTFVPNILKGFNKLLYNHNVQYSKGLKGKMEQFLVQAVPGLAYAFPKHVDPYTGKIQSKYKVPFLLEFINTYSPIKIAAYEVSDIEKIALQYGVIKGELTGNYRDIGQLSAAQVAKANQMYGKWNNQDLKTLYSNKVQYRVQNEDGTYSSLSFSKMTDAQKKSVIERIMTNNATKAKIYIWTQIKGNKYYANESELKDLKDYGISKNVYLENEAKSQTGFY